jgi:hypothetical protein
MLRRLEEYLGHRRSLGYALRIEGDMLLDFARIAMSTCLTLIGISLPHQNALLPRAIQTSNSEIASLTNRHERFAELVQTFFFRLPHQSARHK